MSVLSTSQRLRLLAQSARASGVPNLAGLLEDAAAEIDDLKSRLDNTERVAIQTRTPP